ncbi:serine hydrolase [Desulfopila sp. IMCC35008]|uniref:serine hydrolase domain-containing protein n=1 Tax=Desulfopila sp. IMCC35008 TaxID=2653858 RepID=UPI0013D3AFCE|nr:serine hydrolase [Desulfopila sp. IMCC35008]
MEKQKKRDIEKDLDIIFASALKEGVFPGAAVGFSIIDKYNVTSENYRFYGKTSTAEDATEVNRLTFFDLASLTKPLVTVLSLLTLIEKEVIRLGDNLGNLLDGYVVPKDKKGILLHQLMSHCSGLPAHETYYTKLLQLDPESRKESLIGMILEEPLQGKGVDYIYSDLGFILLGRIIEIHTGSELHDYFRNTVLTPLQLNDHFVFPAKEDGTGNTYAATEICPWTNRLLCGEVHDDNCRTMGGVAGHAGLFGTVVGTLKLSEYFCSLYRGTADYSLVSQKTIREVTRRRKGTNWSCGFDTPSKLYSSSGKYFGGRSIGHLGFTGTSFWCDLERGISIVLLTNRVCPTRKDERIKRYRPKIHDAIMKKILI